MTQIISLALFGALLYFIYNVLTGGGAKARDRFAEARKAAQMAAEEAARKRAEKNASVEQMIECKVCGVHMPASSASKCDRSDCPY